MWLHSVVPPLGQEAVSEMCRVLEREPTSSPALQDIVLATCTYLVCRNKNRISCEIILRSVIRWLSLAMAPGYVLPWESSGEGWEYPSSFAPPLQVAVEASNGASDYGNKFGEPVLSGRGTNHDSVIYFLSIPEFTTFKFSKMWY